MKCTATLGKCEKIKSKSVYGYIMNILFYSFKTTQIVSQSYRIVVGKFLDQ
ncbi:MAG: hypothetical protein ACI9FN_002354 [Saprospiraceae bacterium]|jgi:hypothetical protein